ncbi:MAG: LptA/OstA family protein [Rickettsiaceae bacterium]
MIKIIRYILCIILFMPQAHADLSYKDIYIDSDDLTINNVEHIAHFTGNVIANIGNLTLKTTSIKVVYDANQSIKDIKIDKILIPNKFFAQDKENNFTLIANSAQYNVFEKKLQVSGDVLLSKDNQILKTNSLSYYPSISSDNKIF